jgi:hypothetical protein
MTEYTVHFQHGRNASVRMVTVEAETAVQAVVMAKAETRRGFKITHVYHFDEAGCLIVDM